MYEHVRINLSMIWNSVLSYMYEPVCLLNSVLTWAYGLVYIVEQRFDMRGSMWRYEIVLVGLRFAAHLLVVRRSGRSD